MKLGKKTKIVTNEEMESKRMEALGRFIFDGLDHGKEVVKVEGCHCNNCGSEEEFEKVTDEVVECKYCDKWLGLERKTGSALRPVSIEECVKAAFEFNESKFDELNKNYSVPYSFPVQNAAEIACLLAVKNHCSEELDKFSKYNFDKAFIDEIDRVTAKAEKAKNPMSLDK